MPDANTPFVPDWAKDAIWYQIFPERFRNGAPQSNPRLEDLGDEVPAEWAITPWGMEWYGQAEWEQRCGPFYRSVYHRRYGGDLIGIREKLGYLQDLGVNALYLNPVFTARSLHKYDGASFHHVDPAFGPDRAGDLAALAQANETEDPGTWIWTTADRFLVELVQDVHERGMHIILDGVFNHTGREFFAFQDLLEKGKRSRYRDWYQVKRWKKDGTFSYLGWFGHQGLPELGRVGDDLVAPVREYIFNSTRRWMDPDGDGDPSDGIDGWRLDVAFCVPLGFWRHWRKLVRSINPDAYLTGEIVELAPEYVQGDVFDAVMNYMWLYPSVSFFRAGPRSIPAAKLREKLEMVQKGYPEEVGYVLQNLLDSHDVGRMVTMLENVDIPTANWDDYFESSRAKNCSSVVTNRPSKLSFDILRQMIVYQMAYLGAPMLYYGTEVGMWGANDPDNRQPMLWNDYTYAPETHSHRGAVDVVERSPDTDLFQFVQKAIRLRKDVEVFRRGSLRWLEHDNPRVIGFERANATHAVMAWFNAGTKDETLQVKGPVRDLWAEGTPERSGAVNLPARGWLLLENASAGADSPSS